VIVEAVRWRDGVLEIIDQTLLPHELFVMRITTLASCARPSAACG